MLLKEMFPEAELLSQKRPPTVRANMCMYWKCVRTFCLDHLACFSPFHWCPLLERLQLSSRSVSMNWWTFSCPRNLRTCAASSQMTWNSHVSNCIAHCFLSTAQYVCPYALSLIASDVNEDFMHCFRVHSVILRDVSQNLYCNSCLSL